MGWRRKAATAAAAIALSACQLVGGSDERGSPAPAVDAGGTGASAGAAGNNGAGGSGGGSSGGSGAGGSGGEGGSSGAGGSSGGAGGTGGVPSGCVTALASGSFHVCARRSDGALYCWGANDDAQAIATAGVAPTPTLVAVPAVKVVGAGNQFTCAMPTVGYARCWGHSELGQLGEQTSAVAPPKEMLQLGQSVDEIRGGYGFACARVGGELLCWGANSSGQLGRGHTTGADCGAGICIFLPASPTGVGPGVTSFGAGWDHACAVQDGGLLCWGRNLEGQVGKGSTGAGQSTPYAVFAAGSGVVSIAGGAFHSCALKADGSVWCWGKNTDGQLGLGTTSATESSPQQVLDLGTDNAQISAGGYHTCVRRTDGTVWCWGANSFGQLGYGVAAAPFPHPTPIATVTGGVTQVVAGEHHTCVLLADATVRCWGRGEHGQMGVGVPVAEQVTAVQPLVPCL